MLAQNFKTAADLGISKAEHLALQKVLGMLERQEFVETDWKSDGPLPPLGFNMGMCFDKDECGTVGCIGGWAAYFMSHPDPSAYVKESIRDGALHGLYWDHRCSGGNISQEAAAAALRSFLSTGDANWKLALSYS